MKNIEKFAEEIKKQLLNVKLMSRDDIRLLNYKKPEEENPFIEYYDPTKDESYFKIVEFKDGYEFRGGYTLFITCELHRYRKPEIHEMDVDFYNDGTFKVFSHYISFEYWGKIDI